MTCKQAYNHHAQHGPGEHLDYVTDLIDLHPDGNAHCECLEALRCRTVHPETGDFCPDG